MTIITEIIEQHAEETAFNWLLRSSAVAEPHYDLPDLVHLDDCMEAHLDGLRIAGEPGWRICKEAMAHEEPGEIFTAGVLAFGSGDAERMDGVLAAVETDPGLQGALISALGWIDFKNAGGPVRRLMSAKLPFLRYLGLAAHAVHRQDPGEALNDLLGDPEAAVRARAFKAAGELGRRDLLALIVPGYMDEEEKVRFYAARSGALLGDARAAAALQALVQQGGPWADRAVRPAASSLAPADARHWLGQLAQCDACLPLAVQGYGALGDPGAVDWLISLMQRPDQARAAGEAFSMITGCDIAYEDLETDAPEDFQAGPTEDPDDDDVAPDPDENLPWPDPARIASWWHDRKKEFQHGVRHLAGQPVSDADHLKTVLKTGFQRQRIAAAFALASADPGMPLFEHRAPAKRQRRLLAANSRL
jgi:uncharacterized protein (TIGR02270 family)